MHSESSDRGQSRNVKTEGNVEFKKGSKFAKQIKNEVGVYQSGERFFVCDSSELTSSRQIELKDLGEMFANQKLEFIFWQAEQTLRYTASKGLSIPSKFFCAYLETCLWTNYRTKHYDLSAAFSYCWPDEDVPSTDLARAWAVWWLHSDEISEVRNAESTYMLKLSEIKKKLLLKS